MPRRNHRHEHEHDATAPDVAPVDPDDDADALHERAAHVYPTEHDEAEALAEVLDADPAMANATHHALSHAIRERIDANAERAARRRRALTNSVRDVAPLFPTDAHAGDLRDAIPTIADDEIAAVLLAGYDAFVASIDAHEPITQPQGV